LSQKFYLLKTNLPYDFEITELKYYQKQISTIFNSMNFLLRRIAGTLRQMSLIQLGLRRHNVARFRFLGIAFIRLISFTLVSTLGLAVFGVGFYHTLIGFDIVQPSSQAYSVLIYIMSMSAA